MQWLSRTLIRRTISIFTSHLPPQLHSPTHNSPPPVLPTNHFSHLLSLLLEHQHHRNPSLQLHAHLITTSFLHRQPISTTALRSFNTLLRHYSLGRSPEEALLLYKQLQDLASCPLPADSFTFAFLVKACANSSTPENGRVFHSLVVKTGFEFHVYVHTALVDMYAVCGHLGDARKVFDEMPERNLVTWNVMITGLVRHGELGIARELFEEMPVRDVVSWTGLIDGYTRAQRPAEALSFLLKMIGEGVLLTEVTVLAVAPAISNLGHVSFGQSIHAFCEKNGLGVSDVRVKNTLIDMYAKCGSIESSLRVFESMSWRRNLVSWTSIISGLAMHGMAREAVTLFDRMMQENVLPNRVTFLSVLNACSHGGLVEEGVRFFSSMVHEYEIEPEIKHYGCVIDMLGRAGRLLEAEKLIEGVPMEVNAVVWRTLLGCCRKHGDVEMGERVMRRVMELEKGYGGDYVILSNLLTEAGRFGDAERMRRLMEEMNAFKVAGVSSVGGKD